MSEKDDRNLQSAAPDAADIREEKEAKDKELKEAQPAKDEPAPAKPEREKSSRKRGKKRNRRGGSVSPLAVALTVALVVVLVIFGVLVGYGLGRVRGGERRSAEPESTASAIGEPAYDAFTEALTQQNEQALDALSGENAQADPDLSMLIGEEGLLVEDAETVSPPAEPVVVAEYGDGKQVMSDEVLDAYNEQLSYDIFGGSSEEDVAEPLLNSVLQSVVSEHVQQEHARELGLYELSDEDRAEIDAQAQSEFEDWVNLYREGEVDTSGMSDAEAEEAIEAYLLESEGISRESIAQQIEDGWWERKLFDYVTESVTIDDAAIQEAYDSQLAEQQADFTEYPIDFEFAQWGGDLVLYNLPGYRAVKLLLLGFDDDEAQSAVEELTDELNFSGEGAADGDERQALLDGYYAGPEARAREILDQLRGGADMDELLRTVGEDEGMRDERQREMGYYISADSSQPRALVDAAMALQNPGDYSEPVRTENGVCILQYIGEVDEGPVPLEQVRDELSQVVLSEARDRAYTAQVRTWLSEANPVYYPERMQ